MPKKYPKPKIKSATKLMMDYSEHQEELQLAFNKREILKNYSKDIKEINKKLDRLLKIYEINNS